MISYSVFPKLILPNDNKGQGRVRVQSLKQVTVVNNLKPQTALTMNHERVSSG